MDNSEKILISSVMLRPEIFDVVGFVDGAHFENQLWGRLFSLAKDMYGAGEVVDAVTVYDKAGRQQWVVDANAGLDSAAGAIRAEDHARRVKDGFVRRQVAEAARSIIELSNSGMETAVLLGTAEKAIKDAMEGASIEEMHHIGEVLEEAQRAIVDDSAPKKIHPTGFAAFDNAFGGLVNGLVHVFAGRPSMGKTAFEVNMIKNMAKMGDNCALFTLEDTEHLIASRMIADEEKLDFRGIVSGKLHEGTKSRLAGAVASMRGLPIWMCDKGGLTVPKIRHMCIRQRQNNGLDAIFVDHLGELGKDDDAYSTVSMAIKGLRDIAKEMDVPMVVLSQLNRRCESRDDKRPTMADLRDSGKIEEVARMVCFLYRDAVYNEDADPSIMEVICRKNTNGPQGTTFHKCEMATMSIY
jgi:replicative DNA helicase